MHNYEKNIHMGDVESKRRVVSGEDEVLEICGVVEGNGISMKKSFVKMWISSVKLVKTKDICTHSKNITAFDRKLLLK